MNSELKSLIRHNPNIAFAYTYFSPQGRHLAIVHKKFEKFEDFSVMKFHQLYREEERLGFSLTILDFETEPEKFFETYKLRKETIVNDKAYMTEFLATMSLQCQERND